MRAVCLLTTTILLATVAATASADGLIHKLPEDGTWALFEMSGGEQDANDPKDFKKGSGTLKLSSVGAAAENGEKCRWIELEAWITYNGRESTHLHKLLIPEKRLTKGETPAEHVVRGWERTTRPDREGEVRELRTVDSKPRVGDIESVLLGGPGKDVKKLEVKVIETKLGKLKCDGVTGTFISKMHGPGGVREMEGTFEAWFHEKAPFGVVAYYIETKEPNGDIVTINLDLSETGTTALSQLPKHE